MIAATEALAIMINKFEHPLFEYEDFLFDKVAKMLKKNRDEIRFSTIQTAGERVNDYSADRIDYIKKSFMNIIDNIVNCNTKTMH